MSPKLGLLFCVQICCWIYKVQARDPTQLLNSIFPGQHILGGTFRQNGISVGQCFTICMMTAGCLGVDYDTRDMSCWTHTNTTECTGLVNKAACTHYRLTSICSASVTGPTAATPTPTTQAPTTQTPTTQASTTATTASTASTTGATTSLSTPTVMATFTGMHILGGVEVNANTSAQCLASCIGTCQGVDFNSATNGCFHHSSTTECNALVAKAACTHFRLVMCPTTPTTAVTTASAQTTVTTAVTTAASTSVPNGYFARNANMNILGGTLVAVGVNEMQCTDLCLGMFTCLAADYNANDTSCWFHGSNTSCNALSPKVGCTNFRKLPCLTALGTTNNFVETIFQFHIFGGTQLCGNCTFEACLNLCSPSVLCQGVDYNMNTATCFQHTSATVCNVLNSKSFCRHVRKVNCPTTMPTTAPGPTPFPAPQAGFTVINFAGPSVLPSGWQAYPGNNIAAGSLLATGLTGDACFNAIAANATCDALDFNTGDGSCWCHDSTRKCNALTAMNIVYHAKKPPPCTVITGTTTPYPAPVATAP